MYQVLLLILKDTIWINHKGIMERYTISGKTNNPQIVRHPDFTHPHLIKYAFYSDEKIIMVDSEGNIFYKEKENYILSES